MDQTEKAVPGAKASAGLSCGEVERRLRLYGANAIPEPRARPLLGLLKKFWAPIPWMLEAAILIQFSLGKYREAAIVVALLSVNAAISFVQEGRASRALALLRGHLARRARVFREGQWRSVPTADLVPGDWVHLRMGDFAPADIRIGEGHVQLDQSALTGESAPVEAGAGASAYAASVVRRGEASGEVVATGARTYFGRTADLVRTAKAPSRLEAMIFSIVRALVVIDAVLVCALTVYAVSTGLPLSDLVPFALALLVASVPVALPATFTLATALGSAELARSGVLVARLSAVEEAAGMDVLCTDKTGTITQNRLALTAAEPTPSCSETELLRQAALASDPATQDPIDLAVLTAAADHELLSDRPKRLRFVPFNPERRYSLAAYEAVGGQFCVAKGAPQAIAALAPGGPELTATIDRFAAAGNRVLAVAAGPTCDSLRLSGLLALEDPPRADSLALVQGLQDLGVRVLMVTGDNAETARAIAERVGIGGRVVTSEVLDRLGANEALDHDVYARVFPEHKVKLVRLLQGSGHVVGMTGDGVNDAPALKQANVGVAVASATDVAREAAGVVLTRPGLADALSAVTNSRRIYQRMLTYSIAKIIKTLEVAGFLTLGVMATGAFVVTPRLIILMLFANDFVTIAIATDRVSYSRKPDRWNIQGLMLTGGTIAALMLLFYFFLLFVGRTLLGLPLAQLQTLVFVMLVATGQGIVYLVRERGPFWRTPPSRWLLLSSIADLVVVSVMAVQGILMTPVSPLLIGGLLAAVCLYLLVLDQVKIRVFQRFEVR